MTLPAVGFPLPCSFLTWGLGLPFPLLGPAAPCPCWCCTGEKLDPWLGHALHIPAWCSLSLRGPGSGQVGRRSCYWSCGLDSVVQGLPSHMLHPMPF